MIRVISEMSKQLHETYRRVHFTRDSARDKMLTDVRFAYRTLKSLEIETMDDLLLPLLELENAIIDLPLQEADANLQHATKSQSKTDPTIVVGIPLQKPSSMPPSNISSLTGNISSSTLASHFKSPAAFFNAIFPTHTKDTVISPEDTKGNSTLNKVLVPIKNERSPSETSDNISSEMTKNKGLIEMVDIIKTTEVEIDKALPDLLTTKNGVPIVQDAFVDPSGTSLPQSEKDQTNENNHKSEEIVNDK